MRHVREDGYALVFLETGLLDDETAEPTEPEVDDLLLVADVLHVLLEVPPVPAPLLLPVHRVDGGIAAACI